MGRMQRQMVKKRKMGNSQLSLKENKKCLTHKRLGQNIWDFVGIVVVGIVVADIVVVDIVVVGREYLCDVGEADYMKVDILDYKKAWQIDILNYKKVCWVF